ncbi:MAG: glycoside hydrolase family 30 beta sandwich domain-containing protein [Candidatus Acidiferrales bacterium]
MKGKTSRRDFLGISALGLAAIGPLVDEVRAATEAVRPAELDQASGAANAGGKIAVWVTAGDDRFEAAPAAEWKPAPPAPPVSATGTPPPAASSVSTVASIEIDPRRKFQQILGFGAALTDASCYLFHQLAPGAREKLFHELFHPSEMGLSVCRTCIGSSDYATSLYSFDDGEADPDLKNFSIAHDREYILPMLREARALNPELFLFSSPWSPPGWMKFNGSMLGGSMRNHYFATYAQYLLKFLQGYAAEGVPVQALTPQNEVDTDQDGRMPACIWGQEYEIAFVRDHLGPLFESSGVETKIWILDHNYNLWGRVVDTLEDDKLRQYCNNVAWHGYAGTADMMSKVQDAYPEIEMYWTEGGPHFPDPDLWTDWCKWGGTFSDILRNWCKSITAWNLALDEKGQPNIGPMACAGTVTINSGTKEVTRSGQYWAFAHYSKVMRRGARRIASESEAADLQHVAVENPDGERVMVVTNAGAARTVELRLGNMTAQIALRENSMTTLAWR